MNNENMAVYPPYRLVAQFADGARLLFDGLTDHDGAGQIVPRLAERWDYDPDTLTYTFHLAQGVTWHDGEPFTAADVKFTFEAIMDPDNGSENAPNYEDVTDFTVIDDHTVSFTLSAVNTAFLEYMTMAILPQHLLEGEDMQTADFFRAPVGTGPYKLESWDAGQSITLVKIPSCSRSLPIPTPRPCSCRPASWIWPR